MSFHKKIAEVQSKLNAPKGQFNSFGKYHYRSCEDIVQAVKPLLAERDLYLLMSDKVVAVADRVYIESTATITDGENTISSVGMAREAQVKKGMDDSQITGAASSYSRKYALNGLLAIDDNKDADTNEQRQQSQSAPQQQAMINNQQVSELQALIESKGFTAQQACQSFNIQSLAAIPTAHFEQVKQTINGWNGNNGN